MEEESRMQKGAGEKTRERESNRLPRGTSRAQGPGRAGLGKSISGGETGTF